MLKRVALMLLCCGIVSPAICQQKKNKKAAGSVPVFSVAGTAVTADEFIYLYRKNHQNKAQDFTGEKIDEYLSLFINFKLKVLEAKKRGMDTTDSFVKEYNSYKDELRKPYLPDAGLADSLVRLTYNRMKEEIRASHILINLKPDASPEDTLKAFNRITEIRSRIIGGEDFSRAAAVYSEDPSAKSNHGSLGYFTAMQMVYPFESAAYTTTPGEISQPVRTRFGYHIIKVFDRRPAQGEVEVSHIMIRTGEEKDNEKAKNTIFTIYDQLQAGVAWDELCEQYSEDPASKGNKGKLRPFGTGAMAAVGEFEKTAFSLQKPGEISDPFQTQYGWHIIRLEQKIALPSFEAMAPALKNRVTRDERTTLSKQALQAKLRIQYQLAEKDATKKAVFALADSTLSKGAWTPGALQNSGKEIMFSLGATHYTARDFLAYASAHQKPNAQPPVKYLEQLYNNFVDQSILKVAEEKIGEENPTYGYLLNEYYEGILLFEIMEKEVWRKASEDSVGQRKYYDTHISAYQAGERARAVIYSVPADGDRVTLKELLSAGNEEKIRSFLTQKKVKTESGYFKKDDKLIFTKMPWAAGVYSAENNGIYYLAWLKEILPPGSMSFEEARPAIISDYQSYLEKRWVEELKKKYAVKVNEKGKKYILQKLQS